MPRPPSLTEMASRRGLQILQVNAKNDWTVFITFLFPVILFPFNLPLPTSQLSIIRSRLLVPGPTGLHHVVHTYDRDAYYNVGGVE